MFFKKIIECKNCGRFICPYCKGVMTKRGFEGHNGRYECEECEKIIECINF